MHSATAAISANGVAIGRSLLPIIQIARAIGERNKVSHQIFRSLHRPMPVWGGLPRSRISTAGTDIDR